MRRWIVAKCCDVPAMGHAQARSVSRLRETLGRWLARVQFRKPPPIRSMDGCSAVQLNASQLHCRIGMYCSAPVVWFVRARSSSSYKLLCFDKLLAVKVLVEPGAG